MTTTPGQRVSHYRLLEKIGEGGMGVVWKAEDTVLHRTVAIKVLPADLAGDETRRRMFLHEARLAASVTDAHIVQVHELGREGDLDFIVMEYVEGKPLSQLLHGRPFPPEKVADLGLQVAQALARAHRKGLIHRDLKPGNILVTSDGEIRVVDFGLAVLLETLDPALVSEAPTRTRTEGFGPLPKGVGGAPEKQVMGTLPYMSPEQARGEKLDSRTDIFSFGSVLYEMATGQRPFGGATRTELFREIQKGRFRSPHEIVRKLPLDLDRIIQKALAPRRAERYQTMEDLAVDLKRLSRDLETGSSPSYEDLGQAAAPWSKRIGGWLAGAALIVIVALLGMFLMGKWRGSVDPHTILILPMEVRGQSEGADYVGRSFSEGIAVNLAQARSLTVLPVPEIGEIGGGSLERARAARKTGAGLLLTGTVIREEETTQANLSLVDAIRNRIVWGTQRTVTKHSLTELTIPLAGQVAEALGVETPKRYEHFLYLTGTPAMAASPDFGEALGALRHQETPAALAATRRLIEAFPNEPDAQVFRTLALHRDAWYDPQDASKRRAFEESLAALQRIDPKNPWSEELQASLAGRDGRPGEAISRFTGILARDDLTPAARAILLSQRGQWHVVAGSPDAAIADLHEALRLNPTDDLNLTIISNTLLLLGRREEALARARQAVALNPFSFQNQSLVGLVLYESGRWEDSLPSLKKGCEQGRTLIYCGTFALALHRTGRIAEARDQAAAATSLPENSGGLVTLASYHAVAGNGAEALRLLRRWLELSPALTDFEVSFGLEHPDLASLQSEPDFKAILAEARGRIRKN